MRSNDLAAKLKALSVQVGDMGEEFASVSFGISDLSIELSSYTHGRRLWVTNNFFSNPPFLFHNPLMQLKGT